MAASPHHRPNALLSRLLFASVVWLTTLSLLLVLAPRGAAEGRLVNGGLVEGGLVPGGLVEDRTAERTAGWAWPLAPFPRVVRAFDPPTSRYGPGHRGIDLAAAPGQSVLAVADGFVTHSGVVAGRGTVTVRHPSGVASTYEPIEERIAQGAAVTAGAALGTLGTSTHCTSDACLHLGARLGEEYLDPLLLLTRVRIILLPLVGPSAG